MKSRVQLKTAAEIEAIDRAGSIIGALFAELEPMVEPGVSTEALNRKVDEFICSHEGATPAFKGLYGFPGSACISVNEEVVHGIPKASRILAEGDIVSIDVGVRLDGWMSDSARTFPVGEVDAQTRMLLDVTERSLAEAVAAAQPGGHVGDIGAAVLGVVQGTGLHVIRELVGHGIGRELHEAPQVPNYGVAGRGTELRPGTVVAIEPMLALGTEQIRTLEDRWTVVTADRSRSAHFEHTVAVTEDGPRILTGAPDRVRSQA